VSDEIAKQFAERRWCYHIPREGLIPGRGWRVSVVFEGVTGHYPTGDLDATAPDHKEPWFWGATYDEAEQVAAEANQALGHNEADVVQIISSTMRGSRRRSPRSTRL